MAKSKKGIAFILGIVLLVAAIATGVTLILVNERKKSATAETIMSFSVNPSIQLVLNKKDKVIDVKATNEDGDKILTKVEFIGLSAEEAAELFAQISAEAGYIDVTSTTGTKVTITITGNKEDYTAFKNSVIESTNKYFDENGIIAGAIAEVNEDVKKVFEKISADIEDAEEKTKEELIKLYAEHAKKIEGVAYNQQKALKTSYEALEKVFETATAVGNIALNGVKTAITAIETTIKLQSEELATKLAPVFEIAKAEDYEELQKALENAKKAVKETKLTDEMKSNLDEILTSTQEVLDDMKETYETAKKKFEEDYKKAIDEAITKSNEYFESFKTEFETKINEGKTKLNDRKTYFEANKTAVQEQITAYRNSLKSA